MEKKFLVSKEDKQRLSLEVNANVEKNFQKCLITVKDELLESGIKIKGISAAYSFHFFYEDGFLEEEEKEIRVGYK